MTIDELTDGVLPGDFSSVTIHLVDSRGNIIPLASADVLELTSAGSTLTAAPYLAIRPTGEIAATDIPGLRALLSDRFGPFELRVRGYDPQFRSYHGGAVVGLGRFCATGM